MSVHPRITTIVSLITLLLLPAAQASTVDLNGHRFTLPDGFQVELAAAAPLVERPVSADFDERGRLYVTDSNGLNTALTEQLKNPTSRIRRLTDSNGDGIFDSSTVFVDGIVFPEGALWFEGSLYVAAPPQIWKFTDTDDDGTADVREVWFDGKTITHCGNDLHGPFLGPDGWIYWCKGAFAEQTYERPGRPPLVTKASHIFRRRPEGGPIEAVMTGGMDNPVELAFTPSGERIFTTTFLVHPHQGLRDGLLHAVYGGVYGKNHSVLDGHPRTGDLMPVMTHMGVAAPSGLTILRSGQLQDGWQGDLLSTSFNMHKVVRHELIPDGATFRTSDHPLLISDSLDFHPTDVLEDADGSVLVVDTGGWFRLCCPTSQLEKPDVLGGIYRISRSQPRPPADPRGLQIDWNGLSEAALTDLLADPRFTVRERAARTAARRGDRMTAALQRVLDTSTSAVHRRAAVWTAARIGPPAGTVIRTGLQDADDSVVQAALHAVSVLRYRKAAPAVRTILQKHTHPAVVRAAAEALGRIGTGSDVGVLLEGLIPRSDRPVDRVLEHSLIYAVIEIGDPLPLKALLNHPSDVVRRGALIALDQQEGGSRLEPDDIRALLLSDHRLMNDTAWWIAEQHPEWGDVVVGAFDAVIRQHSSHPDERRLLKSRLQRFSTAAPVRKLIAHHLLDDGTEPSVRQILLEVVADAPGRTLPDEWRKPLAQHLTGPPARIRTALRALRRCTPDDAIIRRLQELVDDPSGRFAEAPDIRLQAMLLLPADLRPLNDDRTFEFVCRQLHLDRPLSQRALAVDILTATPLSSRQLARLSQHLPSTGIMELRPLLGRFSKSSEPEVGRALVRALLKAPSAAALFPDQLTQTLAPFGEDVLQQARPLLKRIEEENRSKVQRVETILALLPQADVRRGQKVFQSAEASCIACHRRGYLGGHIGPDLSRIGRARSARDLLESILFPSLTFVRNFEPTTIVMTDGRVFNGVIRSETDTEIVLQLDAKKSVTLSVSDIEERLAGTTSIMPAGLDKQLSPGQLADLVRYLLED